MANISQHEAAELWELARDHFTTGAKLQFLCQHVQDTQLRATMEQHARRIQQAGQQIAGFIGQNGMGTQSSTGLGAQGSFQSQQFGQFQSAPSYAQTNAGTQGLSHQTGGQGIDILAAGECLKDCKRMAVAAVMGATEASQPARNVLYQLAGEHLQMADQHYRWLEHRGLYASPKADQQTISEYTQKLRQISQAGQQAVQQFGGQTQTQQFFGQSHQYGAQTQQFGGASHQYGGASHQYGGYQHQSPGTQTSFSGAGSTGFGNQYSQ